VYIVHVCMYMHTGCSSVTNDMHPLFHIQMAFSLQCVVWQCSGWATDGVPGLVPQLPPTALP